jgi:hypothetical protein
MTEEAKFIRGNDRISHAPLPMVCWPASQVFQAAAVACSFAGKLRAS